MKRLNRLFSAILIIALSACNSDDVIPPDCFEVKVIESYCTGDAILQIITPAAQAFGQSWTNSDGETYDHVFSTRFPCSFQSARLSQTFSVKLTAELEEPDDCVRCLLLVTGLPEKFSHISLEADCNNAVN